MNSYHFDLDNSHDGPIGFCAAVWARNRAEAVALLRERLPEEVTIALEEGQPGIPGVDYIAVYFNAEALTEADIDEVDEG